MRARRWCASVVVVGVLTACSGDDAGSGSTSAGPTSATGPTTRATTSGPATSTGSTTGGTGDTATTTTPGSTATSTGGSTEPTPSGEPTTTSSTPAVPLAEVKISFEQVATVDQPVGLAFRVGSDDMYVVSQAGRILIVRGGILQANPALDLTDRTAASGEQGLLGLAFSPDGTKAYVHYTKSNGDGEVDELAVRSDGTIDKGSLRPLVVSEHRDYPNHNGGSVVVGPDGLLYLGFGDGGGGGDPFRHALDLGVIQGKILRIDPTPSGDQPYTIPAGNPFAGTPGARPEIWSYGLRNPWRFSFDRATGDIWIGDVGQDQWEEIDTVSAADGAGAGVNFGWSAFEGLHEYNGDQSAPDEIAPIFEYPHGDGDVSVTGGFVYRGAAIPALVGTYLFGDYGSGKVRGLRPNDEGDPEVAVMGLVPGISSFGEDAAGELYVLSLSDNAVYRIVPA